MAPPHVLHLTVRDTQPIASEVVLHGRATLVVRRGHKSNADPTLTSWSVTWLRGGLDAEAVIDRLAEARLLKPSDVEHQVLLSPLDQHRWWSGSPLGVRWQGRDSLGTSSVTSIPKAVQLAGAHVARGPGLAMAVASAYGAAAAIAPEPGDLREVGC